MRILPIFGIVSNKVGLEINHHMKASTVLFLAGIIAILSNIDISGAGYQVYLCGLQGFYIGVLAVGLLMLAGLSLISEPAVAACLSTGIVLCVISLLFSEIQYSELILRCSNDVGYNPLLAT